LKQLGLDERVEGRATEGKKDESLVRGKEATPSPGKDEEKSMEELVVADSKTKEQITEVGKKLGVVRIRLAQGVNYRCGCSVHFLTFTSN
jgi:hypothetical protein